MAAKIEIHTAPAAQPSLPKPRPVDPKIEAEAKPAGFPPLGDWQKVLDDHASRWAHGQALPVLDEKSHGLIVRGLSETIRWLIWPQDLYVPAGAKWNDYWIAPCPPDHRFSRAWTSGAGSDANIANASDGHLFAYAAARISDPHLHTEAGVGFFFTPSAKLAVYKIQPGIAALGQYRWDTGVARDWGGWIRERGFLYTCAWLVSPVDGSLSLVTPHGFAPAFDQSFNNQGGIPITSVTPWPPGPPATNIMLEGGRTYLIGVVAAVQIDNTWTDGHGNPIPSLPPEAVWKVWCTMDCMVSSISISPTTIYIP